MLHPAPPIPFQKLYCDLQGMETLVFINKFIKLWKGIQVYVLKTKVVKINRMIIDLEKDSCDYLKRKRITVFTEKRD